LYKRRLKQKIAVMPCYCVRDLCVAMTHRADCWGSWCRYDWLPHRTDIGPTSNRHRTDIGPTSDLNWKPTWTSKWRHIGP